MSVKFSNQKQFDLGLKKFADKLGQDVDIVVKKVAFDVYKGVAEKTPVDTGYARASWNISPHHPDPSVEHQKKWENKKAGRPVGNMSRLNFKKIRTADQNKKMVERWFITNNVPYIVFLEAGHSIQSAHMVTRTLTEVQANLGTILKEIE